MLRNRILRDSGRTGSAGGIENRLGSTDFGSERNRIEDQGFHAYILGKGAYGYETEDKNGKRFPQKDQAGCNLVV